MRDISSLNIDYSNKWDLKSKFQAKQIVIARALLKNQKRGIDITKFENVKNERIFTVPINFSDYCDVICNYEEICKDVARLDSIVRKRKSLDPINGAVYKIPTIFLIIRRINNSENKYQTFYDELFMNYFRNYIELILFEYKSPISTDDIKELAEAIYEKFNIDFPKDYIGRSLSVSDVVVIHGRAFYVDMIGFVELEDFYNGQ